MSFGKSRTVTLCSLANFINAADRAIMPIAIIPMAREFKWNLHLQGYILSSFPIGYLTSQLFAHIFVRRFGTKPVLALAVFTWSLVTFATPFLAPIPLLLICSRIALGFGEGLALPTIFHIFSNYVPMEERSRSFSYLIALGSVGQTFAALICPHIAWRFVFYIFGLMGFFWTFMWIVTFRDYAISLGSLGDEEAFIHSSSKIANKNYRWIEFISHWPLWAIYIAHFAMNWSSYIVMVWLPSYLTKTFDADPTNLSFTAFPYVMNCLSGVAAGHFADSLIQNRWTVLSVRRLMTAVGLLGPGLFMLLFISVDNLLLAVVFISISMGLSACNSAGHLSNHADIAPNHAGITFAVSNTLATIPGILAGPVTAELVVASHGRWFPVFILASGVNFVGAIIYQSQSASTQIL
jgi:MFS family permease